MNLPIRTLTITIAIAALAFPAVASSGGAATPAERELAAARMALTHYPDSVEGRLAVAMALARRARERAAHEDYERAEGIVAAVLSEHPGNREATRIQAWVLLGQHDFARAREIAASLVDRFPRDPTAHALLADASAELGDYGRAEAAVQAMFDLRPGTVAALTRASYLREIRGDLVAAGELMASALTRVHPREREDRAWIATHLARLARFDGDLSRASAIVERALTWFPDYHYALAERAAVAAAQGCWDEAAADYRRRYEAAPHPENLYDLGHALARAGDAEAAAAAFAEFVPAAEAESGSVDNANLALIRYWIEDGREPARALRLARRERARRGDIWTRAALVAALHAAGDDAAAREELHEVLAIGTVEPSIVELRAALARNNPG